MIKKIITAPILFYKKCISPLLPKTCRFLPTCSTYAMLAIKRHGAFKGFILAAWRIMRCNPWHQCDYCDPVPESFSWKELIRKDRSAITHKNP